MEQNKKTAEDLSLKDVIYGILDTGEILEVPIFSLKRGVRVSKETTYTGVEVVTMNDERLKPLHVKFPENSLASDGNNKINETEPITFYICREDAIKENRVRLRKFLEEKRSEINRLSGEVENIESLLSAE